MKTVNVTINGAPAPAYATRGPDGAPVVRVYDPLAGHYTVVHSLTPGQVRHVIARTLAPYVITAGNYSTDLGIVGRARTLAGAKRIGRRALRESLPDGYGSYRVWLEDGAYPVAGGTRTLATGTRWRNWS